MFHQIKIMKSDQDTLKFAWRECQLKLTEYYVICVLASKIVDIDSWSIDQNETSFCYTLHFVKENMDGSKNFHILKATIEYILSTERFNVPLFE